MATNHFEGDSITLWSPIKINLALHVTAQREDGYHLLDSLVVFAAKGDELTFERASEDRFSLSGPFAKGLDDGENNLVVCARDSLRQKFPNQTTPVAITLCKNLPVASGLGGGSGDAAATLIALNRLWQLECPFERLLEIGLNLGADVPMCLYGMVKDGAVIAHGVGEEITALSSFPALDIVVVNPNIAIVTPEVFQKLVQKNNPPMVRGAVRSKGILLDMLMKSRNDLYEPARSIAPIIEVVIDVLNAHGAELARMSGSGASCFGVYEDDKAAQQAAHTIQQAHPNWFVMALRTKGQS